MYINSVTSTALYKLMHQTLISSVQVFRYMALRTTFNEIVLCTCKLSKTPCDDIVFLLIACSKVQNWSIITRDSSTNKTFPFCVKRLPVLHVCQTR